MKPGFARYRGEGLTFGMRAADHSDEVLVKHCGRQFFTAGYTRGPGWHSNVFPPNPNPRF